MEKHLLQIRSIVFTIIIGSLISFGLSGCRKGKLVPDYEKRVEIWRDQIPGNSNRSKLSDMNIRYNRLLISATIRFLETIVGSEYKDAEEDIDTYTYLKQIKQGYEKETYEDVPYLIPYVVSEAGPSVIIVPGGGFGYKSIDGGNGEGKDIALALNRRGINAFVFWYRSNPYENPIPQLDIQRAVRFLRYNANDLKINPNQISMIGYSAGGNLVGSFINLIQGKDKFPSGYTKDLVDQTDDAVQLAAMIYPALSYRQNIPMLFASYDATKVRDKHIRESLLNQTDLSLHFSSSNIFQFVAYGTKDKMVGMEETKKYIKTARAKGADVKEVEVQGGDHSFGQKNYMEDYIEWLNEKF